MASVVAALGSNQQPVAIDRARIHRARICELALDTLVACWATTQTTASWRRGLDPASGAFRVAARP